MKLLSLLVTISIFSLAESTIPVSKYDINWKELITPKKVKIVSVNDRFKCKKYIDIEKLNSNKYRAKHYILKNKPICVDDVFIAAAKKVKFNFGSLEIVKDGEIIKETNKYIKIKNLDGKIEKIYKDELGQ